MRNLSSAAQRYEPLRSSESEDPAGQMRQAFSVGANPLAAPRQADQQWQEYRRQQETPTRGAKVLSVFLLLFGICFLCASYLHFAGRIDTKPGAGWGFLTLGTLTFLPAPGVRQSSCESAADAALGEALAWFGGGREPARAPAWRLDSLQATLAGAGFHRRRRFEVSLRRGGACDEGVEPPASACPAAARPANAGAAGAPPDVPTGCGAACPAACEIAILQARLGTEAPQALPAGVFADPYELAGLEEAGRARRSGLGLGSGARARVFGAVDLEALEPAASPTLLALLGPAQARPPPPRSPVQLLWAPGSVAGAALLALHRCLGPLAPCGGLQGRHPTAPPTLWRPRAPCRPLVTRTPCGVACAGVRGNASASADVLGPHGSAPGAAPGRLAAGAGPCLGEGATLAMSLEAPLHARHAAPQPAAGGRGWLALAGEPVVYALPAPRVLLRCMLAQAQGRHAAVGAPAPAAAGMPGMPGRCQNGLGTGGWDGGAGAAGDSGESGSGDGRWQTVGGACGAGGAAQASWQVPAGNAADAAFAAATTAVAFGLASALIVRAACMHSVCGR